MKNNIIIAIISALLVSVGLIYKVDQPKNQDIDIKALKAELKQEILNEQINQNQDKEKLKEQLKKEIEEELKNENNLNNEVILPDKTPEIIPDTNSKATDAYSSATYGNKGINNEIANLERKIQIIRNKPHIPAQKKQLIINKLQNKINILKSKY